MIKILIADSNKLMRRRLKNLLENTPDMIVLDEASHGAEAITKALDIHFDVILLDISLPGISGLDVLTILRAQKPNLPILMLSIYGEEEYREQAVAKGASGYLTKENAFNELINAVRKISTGEKYINHSMKK